MTTRIVTIHDLETLTMISQICDSDHPAFSDAASCPSRDALSVAPSLSQDVRTWNDQIQPDDGPTQVIQRMEEWTDYRQQVLELLKLANAAGSNIP